MRRATASLRFSDNYRERMARMAEIFLAVTDNNATTLAGLTRDHHDAGHFSVRASTANFSRTAAAIHRTFSRK